MSKGAHIGLFTVTSTVALPSLVATAIVPEPQQVSTDDLSQTVCRVMSQVGSVAEVVSDALLDGVITADEADLIEREFQGALTALGEWRARIRVRSGRV